MTTGRSLLKGLPKTARWITIPDTEVQVLRAAGTPRSLSGLRPQKFGRFLRWNVANNRGAAHTSASALPIWSPVR